jgi:1-acyl-sn-glycerol-3-phosphate acyltransferase
LQLYFAEPYRFVPPYRGTFWCRLAAPLIPTVLRRYLSVRRWEVRGGDRLREALRRRDGILLTSNHCRWADPVVVAALGLQAGAFFHYLVAHHMFRQGRLFGWWLHRLGGYGINREAADRAAVHAGARILAEAARPLVVFPEGTWYRQNDRLGPLREGLALIARRAARESSRPLVALPLALKYWLLEDPRPVLVRRLARLEAGLGVPKQDHLPIVPRVEALSDVFLARREAEHLGAARGGPFDERRLSLADAIVSALEARHAGRPYDGDLMARVLRLRRVLVGRLAEAAPHSEESAAVRRPLDELLLVEWLNSHSQAYLDERPSLERQAEAVQRLEEILTDDIEQPVAPLGAVVEVGEPLPVREWVGGEGRRREGARLVEEVGRRTQRMLDGLLAEGPPPAWHCPPRAEAAGEEVGSGRGERGALAP